MAATEWHGRCPQCGRRVDVHEQVTPDAQARFEDAAGGSVEEGAPLLMVLGRPLSDAPAYCGNCGEELPIDPASASGPRPKPVGWSPE
jgi:hypothetical protein